MFYDESEIWSLLLRNCKFGFAVTRFNKINVPGSLKSVPDLFVFSWSNDRAKGKVLKKAEKTRNVSLVDFFSTFCSYNVRYLILFTVLKFNIPNFLKIHIGYLYKISIRLVKWKCSVQGRIRFKLASCIKVIQNTKIIFRTLANTFRVDERVNMLFWLHPSNNMSLKILEHSLAPDTGNQSFSSADIVKLRSVMLIPINTSG